MSVGIGFDRALGRCASLGGLGAALRLRHGLGSLQRGFRSL
jgi:hypothetical protein